MPKKIYDNFLNGLSSSERNAKEGSYYQGENLDPHRSPGFIRPGWAESNKTTSGVVAGLILDACYDPDDTNRAYAISDTKLYELTASATTFTSDADFPHTVVGGLEVFFYYIGATRKLFYILDTDMGMSDTGSTFDDDWISTVPAGAGALQSAPHPKIEWKSYVFIGNGQYVARLDGQTGANGTVDLTKLDLGKGWEVTSLFSTENYIGVCAWRKMNGGKNYETECKIFMWDGTSTTFDYFIPIEDNKIMTSYNDNGTIYILTTGKGFGHSLRVLLQNGAKLVRNLKFDLDGTFRYFYTHYPNTIDMFQGRLTIGTSDNVYGASLFTYGATFPEFPKTFAQPYHSIDCYGATDSFVGMVKQLFLGSIYASFYDGTDYYWMRFRTGDSTNAKLKMPYTDLGQRVKINYVKFYFKPLESGDDLAVGIDYNYGTTQSLGTIQYATDGVVTSKLFRKDISGKICDNFRPTITWTAGGVQISKIVVDYSYIGD